MEPSAFNATFTDILTLNASEGPRSNIFEPKFAARDQMVHLKDAVANVYRSEKSLLAMLQLCRCFVFIGTTMMEVDEEVEGVVEIQKAYSLLCLCVREELIDSADSIVPTPLDDILHVQVPFLTKQNHYFGAVEFIRVHNALGLFFSSRDVQRRLQDAKQVLEVANAAYEEWDCWFSAQPEHCVMAEIPVRDDGHLKLEDIPKSKEASFTRRFEMDTAHTSTLFFLAQAYAALAEVDTASRFCHRTMYFQLLNKQEFSRKDWATNALQLSGFYSGRHEYGKALHCLQAGALLMAEAQADEEGRGIVAWSFGRYYLHRLHYYGSLKRGVAEEPPHGASVVTDECWTNFPLDVPAATDPPPITTYDEARETFKAGNKYFQEALHEYAFESHCTEHIEVLQDITRLYAALTIFETSRSRVIAMVQRQIALIEKLPDELNFNAYPIVVRQLLYDLGSLHGDLLRLRQAERQRPQPDEKPLKNRAWNALVERTCGYYDRFCETWRHPTTHVLPDVLDEDSRAPFFRALMERAQVEMKRAYDSAKEEYDGIGHCRELLARAVAFAEVNLTEGSSKAAIDKEVATAKELRTLLSTKQRDIWMAYQRTLPH